MSGGGVENVCRLCACEVADGQRLFAGDKGGVGAEDTGCGNLIWSMEILFRTLNKNVREQPMAKKWDLFTAWRTH